MGKNISNTNTRDERKPKHDTAEIKPVMVIGYFNRFLKKMQKKLFIDDEKNSLNFLVYFWHPAFLMNFFSHPKIRSSYSTGKSTINIINNSS